MPNSWSIALGCMEATHPEAPRALKDKTDNRFDRLAGAIAISAVMSMVANEAEDDGDRLSFRQGVSDAAAQEAARVGGRMVKGFSALSLKIQETLRMAPRSGDLFSERYAGRIRRIVA
jgi:type IV secretory pathway VirB10-like protein